MHCPPPRLPARIVGTNTITLNEATMVRAVQAYLDSMTSTAGVLGRVTGVKMEAGQSRHFAIDLDGQPTEAETQ